MVLSVLFIFSLLTAETNPEFLHQNSLLNPKQKGTTRFHRKNTCQRGGDSPCVPRLADGPVAEAAMAMAAKTFGTDLAEQPGMGRCGACGMFIYSQKVEISNKDL